MSRRFLVILAPATAMSCWLGMMLVHECGHMLAAVLSGGRIERVVFHPLAFSRTDLSANPHPLPVAWAGPLVGALLPCISCLLLRRAQVKSWLAEIFAGFCLVANGLYIGVGSIGRIGDAGDLLRQHSLIWTLWLFGIASTAAGIWIFHQLGPALGLITRARTIDTWLALAASAILIGAGLLIGR